MKTSYQQMQAEIFSELVLSDESTDLIVIGYNCLLPPSISHPPGKAPVRGTTALGHHIISKQMCIKKPH